MLVYIMQVHSKAYSALGTLHIHVARVKNSQQMGLLNLNHKLSIIMYSKSGRLGRDIAKLKIPSVTTIPHVTKYRAHFGKQYDRNDYVFMQIRLQIVSPYISHEKKHTRDFFHFL